MKKLRNLATAGALITALSAVAVPAKRITFTATQPDGTQVTLTRAGDEFYKYFLTDDGQAVIGDEINGYYFAEVDAATGRVKASRVKAADSASRTAAQKAFVSGINRDRLAEAEIATADASRLAQRTQERTLAPKAKASLPAQSGIGLFPGASFPRTGSPKGLIILVQYTDVKFKTTNAADYFSRMINEKGFKDYNGTGSVLEWFTDASMGQFTPDFDVYGPVTLPQNQAYYGGNDSSGNDKNPEQMIIDGCKLLDSQIYFKDYDTDGDGYVDNVFVFYAGQGEASYGSANCVWPHQWELASAGKSLTLDGVKISRYACTNEWEQSAPDGIGTFVHEFSHVMGLPDLYHTSSNSAYYTPCEWSVLDYGPYNNNGRTPPTYSIFERNAMGWIDPLVLDKTPRSVSLNHIESSNYGCLIPTSKNTEFFLLENRQQSGWDKYLPGHGMLIWHIDYNSTIWRNNTVNNTKSHQYVDIEEANNNPTGSNSTAIRNWAFPGTSGQYTSFTDTTTPNMKTWSGASLGIPVTNIKESNGVITFDVCGGAPSPSIEAPVAFTPQDSEIGADYFIASWGSVDGATDYLLTVHSLGEQITATDTNNFGSGSTVTLPAGWTSSHTKTYTSSGNFGASSPSYRMEEGYYIQTPVYDYPISKISFWAKGQGQSNNTATLYAVDGGKETKLTDITDWNMSKGSTKEYDIPANNVYQLKLIYNKESNGNLAIDDMVITYSSEGATVVPAYNGASTSGATSVRVENLPEGKSKFRYSVMAVDKDGVKSSASNQIDVELKTSGIANIDADDDNAPVEYFNLQGIRVENPGNGIFIRRQGSRVEKIIK